MFGSSNSIKLAGFSKNEVLNIKAGTIYEASKKLGFLTKELTSQALMKRLKNGKKSALIQAGVEFKQIREVIIGSNLRTSGVSYGDRYIESLMGFAEGAGISLEETAFLQKEVDAGCQTVISKNANGEIGFFHTEENDDDNRTGIYSYRVVNMTLPGRHFTFFYYPGLCSWGSAFAIDKANRFVQFSDDLAISSKFDGLLWSNMIASILFDAGSIKKAKILINKIAKIADKFGYFGPGYATHQIEDSNVITYEYAGRKTKIRKFEGLVCQVNMPKDLMLRKMSSFLPSGNGHWPEADKSNYIEMLRREVRLQKIMRSGMWDLTSPESTIETGLKVLAHPYGDLRRYKTKNGKVEYYHTGLPSIITMAHAVGFIGTRSKFYIGKNAPKQIWETAGNRMMDENYPYQEEKIYELVKTFKIQK